MFFAALIALLSFIIVKKFIFDIRKINNMDMQETFYKGDALLIKKFGITFLLNDIVYIKYQLITPTIIYIKLFNIYSKTSCQT